MENNNNNKQSQQSAGQNPQSQNQDNKNSQQLQQQQQQQSEKSPPSPPDNKNQSDASTNNSNIKQQSQPQQQQQQQQSDDKEQQSPDNVKQLTFRGVKRIIETQDNQELKQQYFYLQVINVKVFDTVAQKNEGKDEKKQVKMRFTLSDGESTILAMMNKQVYDKMEVQDIPQNSIIQVFTFIKQAIQNRVILVLSRPPKIIFRNVQNRIGQPKDYEQNKKDGFNQADKVDCKIPQEVLIKQGLVNKVQVKTQQEDIEMQDQQNQPYGDQQQKNNRNQFIEESYTPIKALSTFNYDWRIKARCTKKGEVRRWKNQRTEGYLMNIELMDKHGTQIQATFFKDACDKFEPIIQEGCIYLLSNGNVKMANQRFTSIKNDFCLIFDKQGEIIEVPNDESIKNKGFSFVSLKEIKALEKTRAIDVIGIVSNVDQITTCQLKNGQQKDKRMVSICDESGYVIQACFWSDQAHAFDDLPDSPVIACKNIRVVEYGGKTLNQHEDTYLELRPKHPRALELRQWYDNLQNKDTVLKPVFEGGDKDFSGRRQDNLRLIAEMNHQVGQFDPNRGSGRDQFYVINGYISFIRNDEKAYYLACPDENCRRKVAQTPSDPPMYHCEHCNKTYEKCNPTFMLLAKVSDLSDNVFINFYREQGSVLMNISPEEIKRLKDENNISTINDIFYEAHFKYYQILVKAQVKSYGDEQKINLYAFRCNEHTWKSENQNLLKRLDIYQSIPLLTMQ